MKILNQQELSAVNGGIYTEYDCIVFAISIGIGIGVTLAVDGLIRYFEGNQDLSKSGREEI